MKTGAVGSNPVQLRAAISMAKKTQEIQKQTNEEMVRLVDTSSPGRPQGSIPPPGSIISIYA